MKKKGDFKDKVAWITGASSGIGEALARQLAAEGARLVLSSRKAERLEEARGRCAQADAHICLPMDLAEGEKCPGLARQVLERFGRVDFLFNNGGLSVRALARETCLEVDRRLMEIDYFGQIALTKAVLPSMLERRSGHIVVTTSVMGMMPAPLRSAYCAAKHALHGFFDTLRTEVWQEGIRITLLCPAAVRTNISVNALTGTGERFGRMDRIIETGISPEACAGKTLDAVRKGKREVVIGRAQYRYGVWARRLLPALYYAALKRTKLD